MTKSSIHKKIFRNLFVGGLVIALLAGVSVYFIEQHQIDDYVADLALQESSKYTGYYVNYYNNPSPENLTLLKNTISHSLDHELFMAVEIYDESLNKIVASKVPDFKSLHLDIDKNFPEFVMGGTVEYLKVSQDGEQYVKVMLPISAKGNQQMLSHFGRMLHTMQSRPYITVKSKQIVGHFVGVYHVSDKVLGGIKKQIFYLVGYAILIVILTTLLIYPVIIQLSDRLSTLSLELLESNVNTIKSLGSAIAKRDSDTHAHNYRVTLYSVRLAEKYGLCRRAIQALIKGAFLHDIGKIGIPDAILRKPSELSESEFNTMRRHVLLGKDIVEDNEWLKDAVDVVQYHHEKYDGSGYTKGIRGDAIPINARIFAIADVFDALTSKRPYKSPFSFEKSLTILKQGSGIHFDPVLIHYFEQIAEQLYQEVGHLESEAVLSQRLDKLINHYFNILD